MFHEYRDVVIRVLRNTLKKEKIVIDYNMCVCIYHLLYAVILLHFMRFIIFLFQKIFILINLIKSKPI